MAEVSATRATLRVIGDNLEPEVISELLGCNPTSASRMGETVGRKHTRIARTGGWSLEASARCPGNLEAQINEILG